jgi:tetratricopeptide (TPR) repeat protein
LSLRALALQRLGRKQEAEAVIAQALMLGPNNDFTHTAQGWRLLQKHKPKAARDHFLEALRINPQNRWARSGLASARAASRSYLLVFLLSVALAPFSVAEAAFAVRAGENAVFRVAGALAMGVNAIAVGRLWILSLRKTAK